MMVLLPRISLRMTATVLTFAVASVFAGWTLLMLKGSLDRSSIEAAGLVASARARMAGEVVGTELGELTSDLRGVRSAVQQFGLGHQPAQLQQWLETLQRAKDEYAWIGITDASGTVVVGTHGLKVGTDERAAAWFQGGRHALYFGAPREATTLRRELPPLKDGEAWHLIDIAMPVTRSGAEPPWVLVAHLSWPWLRSRLYSVDSAFPAGSELWLLGPDARAWMGPEQLPGRPLALESVRWARQGKSGWLIEQWPDGHRYVTGYSPVVGRYGAESLRWTTLVRRRADEWPAAVQRQFDMLLAAAATVVLLVTSAVWLACTVWLRPLRAFATSLRELPEGQRAPQLPAHLPQEFDWLNEAIVELIDRLARKEATLQHALADVSDSFRAVGSSIPGVLGTFRFGPAGKLEATYASESCAHYCGVSAEVLRAKPASWARHAHPDDVQALAKAFFTVMFGSKRAITHPVRFRGDDAQERTLQVTIIQRDAEHGRVFDCIGLDITELNQARSDAERANRAKSDFLSMMSHELRTPLNAIVGLSHSLEASAVDPEQRRQTRYLRESSETLAALLADLLDYVKAGADTFVLEHRPFTLDEVIESSAHMFREAAARKSLALHVQAADTVPALLGDPTRIRQIVQNLLSNAVKFTEKGDIWLVSGAVELPSRPDPARQVQVWISVADTGVGMTPEQLDAILPASAPQDGAAAGEAPRRGLPAAKWLAEKMGGSIEVKSRAGEGTAVTVLIPFDRAPDAAKTAAIGPSRQEPQLIVLVADDYEINRQVLRAILQSRGHVVVEARDGLDAVEAVTQHHPDLILMDLDMPNMDGFEAARRIRSLGGEDADVPIHALTGKAFKEDIDRARDAGMDGHLAKPVKLNELIAILRSAAAIRRGSRPTLQAQGAAGTAARSESGAE